MSRPLRIEFEGAYYHVMNRGLAYQPIFRTRHDRLTFMDTVSEVHIRWGLRILSYCLMGNHYHLCVQTPRVGLSRIMRHIDGVYTQRYNRRWKRDGPLFRGRYRAILIERDPYLLAVSRYIHHNPVKAGLVKRPQDYSWSSLGSYLWEKKRPTWLDTKEVLGYFGGRRKSLLEFMRGELEREVIRFYQRERPGPILGSEGFIQRIRALQGDKGMDREIPERRYLAIGIEACIRAVAKTYGSSVIAILESRRGLDNEARRMAMYVCREIGGHGHGVIAREMGVLSYSTVSSVCAMLRRELNRDQKLKKMLESTRHLLAEHYRQKST